jgi:hypothetical protein
MAAGVADRRRHHARQRPELALGAPEAAHAELHALQARERILQRPSVHVVAVVQRHFGRATGQGLVGAWQALLVGTDSQHVRSSVEGCR